MVLATLDNLSNHSHIVSILLPMQLRCTVNKKLLHGQGYTKTMDLGSTYQAPHQSKNHAVSPYSIPEPRQVLHFGIPAQSVSSPWPLFCWNVVCTWIVLVLLCLVRCAILLVSGRVLVS